MQLQKCQLDNFFLHDIASAYTLITCLHKQFHCKA